jgi:hypothetical protein
MNCDELQSHPLASRYLIKRPKALQWFHNGVLHKESHDERQAGRFELFLDLLCESKYVTHLPRKAITPPTAKMINSGIVDVAIVANFSDDLAEHPDVAHLVKYLIIFAPALHI